MRCAERLRLARSLALGVTVVALTLGNTPALAAKAPASQPAQDPAALLAQSIAAPRTVSYEGQFETIRFSSNRASATIVKIEHRAPP